MHLTALLLGLMAQIGQPGYGYPGRLSTLRPLASGQFAVTANGTYTLDVERVLKLHALTLRRDGDVFGVRAYAGSLSLRSPSGQWGFELPDDARGLTVAWPDPGRARVTQTLADGDWRGEVVASLATDFPAVRFRLRRVAGAGALEAGLVGYGWAQRVAPSDWVIGGRKLTRAAGEEANVPVAADTRALVLRYRDPQGFAGILRLTPAPTDVTIGDDGFRWAYPPDCDQATVVYLLLPGDPPDDAPDPTAAWAAAEPGAARLSFGCDGGPAGRPFVELTAPGGLPAAVPASLSDLFPGAPTFATTMGTVAVHRGPARRLRLDAPPLLETIKPAFRPLPEASRVRVEAWARECIAHQNPDGSFSFGLGRGFYDGTTCAALAEVMGLLPLDLRAQISAAVEKGLRHLWEDQKECQQWPGVILPPEVPDFHASATDYPEIEACVLQATAIYAAQTGGEVARRYWPRIQRQFEQLRWFQDSTGIALASPGPGYWHVIAESAIGGYLGWQALYHLALMAGHPKPAAEAKARAALAWRAWRACFSWREEFGEPPVVVNGIIQGTVECMAEPPWAYVQSTWFTVFPGLELPRADVFGIWRMLRAQPWWEYTGALKSAQRCYDAAAAAALARAGYGDEVRARWADVAPRPFAWDTFDSTAVLAMPAEAWLNEAGLGG